MTQKEERELRIELLVTSLENFIKALIQDRNSVHIEDRITVSQLRDDLITDLKKSLS